METGGFLSTSENLSVALSFSSGKNSILEIVIKEENLNDDLDNGFADISSKSFNENSASILLIDPN